MDITDKHVIDFIDAVDDTLSRLGVNDWRIDYRQERLDSDTIAKLDYSITDRTALFRINLTSSDDVFNVYEIGRHEALHLFLADLIETTARAGDPYNDLVLSVEHSVLHRLGKALDGCGYEDETCERV